MYVGICWPFVPVCECVSACVCVCCVCVCCVSLCVSLCLSLSLFVSLFLSLSLSLFVSRCVDICICPCRCLPVGQALPVEICLDAREQQQQSVCLFICLSVCPIRVFCTAMLFVCPCLAYSDPGECGGCSCCHSYLTAFPVSLTPTSSLYQVALTTLYQVAL